jgi:carbonic anhydrase/acetyltransferase-like protein (isoleucine patch superfamily)
MNAVVMDDVIIGEGSIVGALAFVPQGMQVPARSVLVGNPARVVKEVTDEVLAWKTEGTRLYMTLPAAMRQEMREVVPLESIEEHRPEHFAMFQPKKK